MTDTLVDTVPPEDVRRRHNVNIMGGGQVTLVLVHGYGCNQVMWRHMAPALADRYRVVLLDLVGFGLSDFGAYEEARYGTLQAHAADLVEIARHLGPGPRVVVGHSVGATIGMLADQIDGGSFRAHVMISPSACYFNDASYQGGFDEGQLEQLLELQHTDLQAWSRLVSKLVVGQPEWAPATGELFDSFCRADRRAARQLASATFLGDHRPALGQLTKPTLIVQCTQDSVAPVTAGAFMAAHIPGSRLRLVDNVGHCPHLTRPHECVNAALEFLDALDLIAP